MSMSAEDKITLQKNFKRLIEVNYSIISAHLISSLVIDLEMHADIESSVTERRKMEKLLLLLPSRGASAMNEFIAAVRPSYDWIASKLEEDRSPSNNGNINKNMSCHNVIIPNNSRLTRNLENLKDMSISPYLPAIRDVMKKSMTICRNWYMLAHTMGLDPICLTDIQRDMSSLGGTAYAIHAILSGWITKCGQSKATFKNLIFILEPENMTDVIENLVDLLKSLQ